MPPKRPFITPIQAAAIARTQQDPSTIGSFYPEPGTLPPAVAPLSLMAPEPLQGAVADSPQGAGDIILGAAKRKLFGSPVTNEQIQAFQDTLDHADPMSGRSGTEDALREAVARRTLEADRQRTEGSGLLRTLLQGAAFGVKAGLAAPYGSSSIGAGILGGLEGATGVAASEDAKLKAKEEAATDALSNLINRNQQKTELDLKGEVQRTEAVARLADNVEKVRQLSDKNGKLGANEFRVFANGQWSAVTPKADSALWRFLATNGGGKASDDLEKELLAQWRTLFAAEGAPKTGRDEGALANLTARRQELEGILRNINPQKYSYFLPEAAPTAEELAGPSLGKKVVSRTFGTSLRPQARSATPNLELEKQFGKKPGAFSRLTTDQIARLRDSTLAPAKKKELADLYAR